MSAHIVSGFRLARRRAIVSRPPLNTRSTDTADPAVLRSVMLPNKQDAPQLTRDGKNVMSDQGQRGELAQTTSPPLDRVRRCLERQRAHSKKCIELELRLTWWQGGSRCAVGSEDARRAFPGPGMGHLCPRCRRLRVWSACVSIQEVLLKRDPAGSDIAAELETILEEMK
jgi:hypothetical protein